MIFVDTGAWFASVVPADPDYAAADAWLAQNREPLVTTDFILDETLTLLRARGQNSRTEALGAVLFSESVATLHYLSKAEILDAWDVFRLFSDKHWSFTDCTSKVVMERLGLATAFSFDQHFRQFGTITVVP